MAKLHMHLKRCDLGKKMGVAAVLKNRLCSQSAKNRTGSAIQHLPHAKGHGKLNVFHRRNVLLQGEALGTALWR